jgi:hypothetical protein
MRPTIKESAEPTPAFHTFDETMMAMNSLVGQRLRKTHPRRLTMRMLLAPIVASHR